MMKNIVIQPNKVLVSGTLYKDSKFSYKLELGMMHGNLFFILESQDSEHDNRVIMGHSIEAEFDNNRNSGKMDYNRT
jgi:hypothetical protein